MIHKQGKFDSITADYMCRPSVDDFEKALLHRVAGTADAALPEGMEVCYVSN